MLWSVFYATSRHIPVHGIVRFFILCFFNFDSFNGKYWFSHEIVIWQRRQTNQIKNVSLFYHPRKQTTFSHISMMDFCTLRKFHITAFFVDGCAMFMALFVCYVFISLFIMIFLLRIFDARVSLLYSNIRNTQANKLSIRWHSSLFSSTVGLFSVFVFVVDFFWTSNSIINAPIFSDQISHIRTHNIFSHFGIFTWLKKWPFTMCALFSLYLYNVHAMLFVTAHLFSTWDANMGIIDW